MVDEITQAEYVKAVTVKI